MRQETLETPHPYPHFRSPGNPHRSKHLSFETRSLQEAFFNKREKLTKVSHTHARTHAHAYVCTYEVSAQGAVRPASITEVRANESMVRSNRKRIHQVRAPIVQLEPWIDTCTR